jgi:hypothetical protein
MAPELSSAGICGNGTMANFTDVGLIPCAAIIDAASRYRMFLGALMAINLWLGLYNAPGEWPWTYMFLVVLQLIFLINPPGRSLGIDALAWRRASMARKDASLLSLVA